MVQSLVLSLRQTLYLYRQWLRRELHGRYRGSLLGVAWALLQPLLQLLVFTLVFYRFMGLRWPQAEGLGPIHYGLQVFLGLAVFNFMADVLNRAPQAVLAQPNMVTKVRFPLVVLPAVTVGAAFVQLALGLLLAGVVAGLGFSAPTHAWLAVPFVLMVLVLYGLGLAWWLAALAVYVRDVIQVTPAVTSVLMFISPIFYPPSLYPSSWAWVLAANPLAWSAQALRGLATEGLPPALTPSLAHALAAALLALGGFAWFRRLRAGFADVL